MLVINLLLNLKKIYFTNIMPKRFDRLEEWTKPANKNRRLTRAEEHRLSLNLIHIFFIIEQLFKQNDVLFGCLKYIINSYSCWYCILVLGWDEKITPI